MKRPFFSVVIPTKNRSFYLPLAVGSVLRQTFTDFEVVVVDNDDTNATARIIEKITDPRVRYVRTGGLSMPDNWERGFEEASGSYLALLEDKQAFRSSTLEMVARVLRRQALDIVTWREDSFDDNPGAFHFERCNPPDSDRVERIPTDEALTRLSTQPRPRYKPALPRGTNSCCSRGLYERIRAGAMGRFCAPASPDYTMAYQQLAIADEQWHIPFGLVVAGKRYSNGRSIQAKRPGAMQYFGEVGHLFDKVPIQALLNNNTIYNEFYKVREAVGGNLQRHEINTVSYYRECYRDIAGGLHGYCVDMSQELAAWESALGQESADVQDRVRREIAPIEEHYDALGRKRRWVKRTEAMKSAGRRLGLHQVGRLLRRPGQTENAEQFDTILHAIAATDPGPQTSPDETLNLSSALRAG